MSVSVRGARSDRARHRPTGVAIVAVTVALVSPSIGSTHSIAHAEEPRRGLVATAPPESSAGFGSSEQTDALRTTTSREALKTNRLRAALEAGIFLGAAAIRYQLDGERKKNFDFPSLKERFTLEAWRYDNNPFGINYLWHAVEGTYFHLAARSNGLSLAESAALGFAASFAWEFVFEFREKVSVNDVVFTPGSGIAVGEFFHWLGLYLSSARPNQSVAADVARWTLGFPYALHHKLDSSPSVLDDDGRRDTLGFRADIWHRFSLAARLDDPIASGLEVPGAVGAAEVTGRLVAIPRYRQNRNIRATFTSANVTEARYQLSLSSDSRGSRFRADTILAGWFAQRALSGSVQRASILAGVALAYDYRRERYGEWRDRVALLHLPGLAVESELGGTTWNLRSGIRLHGDFASVEARANSAWREANPNDVGKTIVRKQGYYFGWGLSARAFADFEYAGRVSAEFGGAVLVGTYGSDEGLDRNQEALTNDFALSDRIVDADGYVRLGFSRRGPRVELRIGQQRRRSTQGDQEASGVLTRVGGGLLFPF